MAMQSTNRRSSRSFKRAGRLPLVWSLTARPLSLKIRSSAGSSGCNVSSPAGHHDAVDPAPKLPQSGEDVVQGIVGIS